MWKGFFKEIRERFKEPLSQPPFIGYFLLSIVVGLLGVYFTLGNILTNSLDDGHELGPSIATYFIAILATSFVDLNLSSKIKHRKSFLVFSLLILLVGIALLVFSNLINSDWSIAPSIFGLFLAWFLWIIANSEDKKFQEESFDAAIRNDAEMNGHGASWGEE